MGVAPHLRPSTRATAAGCCHRSRWYRHSEGAGSVRPVTSTASSSRCSSPSQATVTGVGRVRRGIPRTSTVIHTGRTVQASRAPSKAARRACRPSAPPRNPAACACSSRRRIRRSSRKRTKRVRTALSGSRPSSEVSTPAVQTSRSTGSALHTSSCADTRSPRHAVRRHAICGSTSGSCDLPKRRSVVTNDAQEYRRPPTSRRMRPQDRPFPENRGKEGRSFAPPQAPAASLRPEAERRGYVSSDLSFVFTKIRKVERRSKRQQLCRETEYLRRSQKSENRTAEVHRDRSQIKILPRSPI